MLVVRGGERAARRWVTAAVDPEESGDGVLEFAFKEAARRGSHLEVASVLQEPWSTAYLREDSDLAREFALMRDAHEADLTGRVQQVAAGYPGVQHRCHVTFGSAAGILVAASELDDLVVVGARRWGGGAAGCGSGRSPRHSCTTLDVLSRSCLSAEPRSSRPGLSERNGRAGRPCREHEARDKAG